MSDYLSRIHNSAPHDDAELPLLELTSSAWSTPLRYAVSARDETVTLPGGASATFLKSGMRLQLPDASGGAKSDLSFQLVGVTEEVIARVDDLLESGAGASVTVYVYTQLQRSAPQKAPLTLDITHVEMDDENSSISAQFRDVANSTFPRLRFTPENTPGLQYYSN